jgi:putative thioredoxin
MDDMKPSDFSMHGAIDLGARKAQLDRAQQGATARPSGQTGPPGPGGAFVFDVTEETFNDEVVERSRTVPVILDLWATWCEPCKQLSPVLEKLATEANGAWLLAKVDVDANQRLAQALRVQSIPTVMAVVAGQVVPLFQGALPEEQVREGISQLFAAIQQQGLMPEGAGPDDAQGDVPEGDPAYEEAQTALDSGDLDGAIAAFRSVLDKTPNDEYAKAGLAQVQLVQRVSGVDEDDARRQAGDEPNDVAAQILVADLDMYGGRVDEAFDRLVGTVRRTREDDRDRARRHLLDLFALLPAGDPRVAQARRALSSALF